MRTAPDSRGWWWSSITILGIALAVMAIFALIKPDTPTAVRKIAMTPLSEMPDFVPQASEPAQQAYRFAAANPDLIEHFPCYCGCVYLGHTSNLDCYIKAVKADGSIVFDEHAAYCKICVDITGDVMKQWAEGRTIDAIHDRIVASYGQFGPSTEDPIQ